jgi:hypothetical protein
MRYYSGNDGTKAFSEIASDLNLGILITYPHSRTPKTFYALDNGAFSAYINSREENFAGYPAFIKKFKSPDFVVVPDLVAQGMKSFKFSCKWMNKLPEGYPYYLAVQNGMINREVGKVIQHFAGLFVGGTIDWKKKSAKEWIELAHRHDKKCHIGRIGTWQDILWAKRLGADSIDSTSWAQNDSYYHIEYAESQETFA